MNGKFNAVKEEIQKLCCGRSLLLAACLLPGWVGCTTPTQPITRSPTGMAIHAPLGRIGVVATSTVAWFEYQRPKQKGRTYDAPAWAEKGFCLGGDLESIQFIEAAGPAAGFIFLPMLAAGVVGRLAGDTHDLWHASTGLPREKLAPADAAMYRFLSTTCFQESLREQVGHEASRRTSLRITVVKKPFPAGQEQEFAKLGTAMAGTLAWVPPGETARSYLEAQGIDTVLEIRIHEHRLSGKRGTNPDLRVTADVEARLVRLQDGLEFCSRRMTYHSTTARKYTKWTAEEAQALRAEFAACSQSLAQQIVGELLLVSTEPLLAQNADSAEPR